MKAQDPKDPSDAGVERLLAQVPRPSAAPAFKASLRERFLDLADPGASPAPIPITASPDPLRFGPGAGQPERTRLFPFIWPFVLAASVAFILYFVLARDAHPRWRVLEATPTGEFMVDSLRFKGSDAALLSDALQTAHEIRTFDAGLRLQLRDDLVLDIAPGTQLSQMSFPPAGAYTIYANAGALHVCTGPTFSGNRLRILTDNMESTVIGTIFGVDVLENGTCVCCIEGTVRCDPRDGGGAKSVEAGAMCFAYNDGKKSAWGQAHEPHTRPLQELRAEAAKYWKK